jgi:hypothetical protein
MLFAGVFCLSGRTRQLHLFNPLDRQEYKSGEEPSRVFDSAKEASAWLGYGNWRPSIADLLAASPFALAKESLTGKRIQQRT